MAQEIDLTHLCAVLRQLQVPDNDAIIEATAALKELTKQSGTGLVEELTMVLQHSDELEVKMSASILLRQRLLAKWHRLQDEARSVIKGVLLECLVAAGEATNKPFLQSLSAIISVLAKLELPSGAWPALLEYVQQAAFSDESSHRYVGLTVLHDVLSEPDTADQLLPMYEDLLGLLEHKLQDSSVEVAALAVNTVTCLVPFLTDAHTQQFRRIIPSCLAVIRQCLSEDEGAAADTLDFFEECANTEVPFVKPFIKEMALFCLDIASNPEYDFETATRDKALVFLHWLIIRKPKSLAKRGLIPPIVSAICNSTLFTTVEEELEDQQPFTLQVLEVLADNMPPETFLNDVCTFVGNYIHAESAMHRRLSYDLLAAVIRGASFAIKHSVILEQVIQLVLEGLQDSDTDVIKAACITLSRVAAECQPEVGSYWETVLPILLMCVSSDDADVQENACASLEHFLDCTDARISPHLEDIMGALTGLVQQDLDAHQVAISCIGALALAVGNEFDPYTEGVLEHLQVIAQSRSDEHVPIICQAIDTLGLIATSVSRETFGPYLGLSVDLGKSALLELDDPDVKVACYTLFGSLALYLGEEFAPVLSEIAQTVFNSFVSDLSQSVSLPSESAVDSLTFDGEEDADGLDGALGIVHTPDLTEREAAVQLLGAFAKYCPLVFQPYLAETLAACEACMQDKVKWRIEGLRKSTMTTFAMLAVAAFKTAGPEGSAEGVIYNVCHMSAGQLAVEEDMEVAIQILSDFQALFTDIGASAATAVADEIATQLHLLLCSQAKCQEDDYDDQEDEDDEDGFGSELAQQLVDEAGDTLVAFAEALGAESFATYGEILMQDLLNLMSKTVAPPVNIRTLVIGSIGSLCASEVVPYMVHTYKSYGDLLVSLGEDEDEEVRGNAMFAFGLLCEKGAEIPEEHTQQMLASVATQFGLVDQGALGAVSAVHVVDNACGCLARMILCALSADQKRLINETATHLGRALEIVLQHGASGFSELAPFARLMHCALQGAPDIIANQFSGATGQVLVELFANVGAASEDTELVEMAQHLQLQGTLA
eukprot:m.312004 g.312004  ORF g.312004 m.312004 type:complete len:1058 (+) comp15963_c0_seq12:110-3283(+)